MNKNIYDHDNFNYLDLSDEYPIRPVNASLVTSKILKKKYWYGEGRCWRDAGKYKGVAWARFVNAEDKDDVIWWGDEKFEPLMFEFRDLILYRAEKLEKTLNFISYLTHGK
jgi:hypothetical protein